MVVVNLYPFEKTTSRENVSLNEAIEYIDIGGPAMLRSAAKNHHDVAVVVDPSMYDKIISELSSNHGVISEKTCFELAVQTFAHTAHYDSVISDFFSKKISPEAKFSDHLQLSYEKVQELRYGENPHQSAAFYRNPNYLGASITNANQIHGKELSFNNILDLDSSLQIALQFNNPAAVIVKHTNPCGVALGNNLVAAYQNARSTDPQSAFGGVLACNRPVDADTAKEMSEHFLEAIIAPRFESSALTILQQKKNIRLLTYPPVETREKKEYDLKTVKGGVLYQEMDMISDNIEDAKVVTERQPTTDEWGALTFAWKIARFCKSNCVVITNRNRTLGIGAGHVSRVDAVEWAIYKVNKEKLSLEKAVLASDGFFPFRDNVDLLAKTGIKAVVQPGGSIRDPEVIAAANEHKLAMVFTGIRHFKH
jgi:phosphoribosylaminoimidazolecarboxamide formyltransferase/IMP cyclohydrolase